MISNFIGLAFLLACSEFIDAAAAIPDAAQVSLDLTAHDKKGNFVSDLQPSDLEVLDGGVPVRLDSLRLNTDAQSPRIVVLVFDQVVPGVAKTDRSLAEELVKAAPDGVRYMVLKVDGRLHLVQAPTSDLESVKNAIAAATTANRPDYIAVTEAAEKKMNDETRGAAGPQQTAAKRLLAILLDSQNSAQDPHCTPSIAALLAASRGLQGSPGRKFIVYFSQGLAWVANTPEKLREIIEAANQGGVRIDSVDAEIGNEQTGSALVASAKMGNARAAGNIASGTLSGPTAEGAGTGTVAAQNATRIQNADKSDNRPPLFGICERTGGAHASASGGEGHRGVRAIAADLGSWYTASWPVPDKADTGRPRAVMMKSLRNGVIVQAPAAYLPRRSGILGGVSRNEDRLLRALEAPTLPGDVTFHAALLNLGDASEKAAKSLAVEAPANAVSVLAQLRDKNGAAARKFSADLPAGTAANGAAPVQFRRDFTAVPGEYVLETAVLDASGNIGASRANVVIPPVAPGLALGDVLLVRRIDPPESGGASDPLRCAEGIVVPNLSGRVVKAETPSFTIFFDMHPDPESKDALSLAAELRRDGNLIGSVPLKGSESRERTIPYLATLGAQSLRPGNYELTVILAQGGRKATNKVVFRLE